MLRYGDPFFLDGFIDLLVEMVVANPNSFSTFDLPLTETQIGLQESEDRLHIRFYVFRIFYPFPHLKAVHAHPYTGIIDYIFFNIGPSIVRSNMGLSSQLAYSKKEKAPYLVSTWISTRTFIFSSSFFIFFASLDVNWSL